MPHDTHTTSNRNQDLDDGRNLDHYLGLCEKHGWTDPLPPPVVEKHEATSRTFTSIITSTSNKHFNVVREDFVCGKRRFGDLLVRVLRDQGVKELVYVAPRFGHAGMALAKLASFYDLKLTLFMPACVEISDNQARAIEIGAEPIFYRIAAMPNLNKAAKEYAESRKKAAFIPLGLRHELVTAAAVKTAYDMRVKPREVWTAVSTGVLTRALQVAWPKATFHGVAVARNIQDGERGTAELDSYPRAFAQDAKHPPVTFPSASNYDAKCWETMLQKANDGAWFWNVAGDEPVKDHRFFKIDAGAPWGVLRQLDKNWRKQILTRAPDFTDI